MEYLTFALPLALLLTWLGWQIWDERRFRKRWEMELWRLDQELNEDKLQDRDLLEHRLMVILDRTRELNQSMTGSPREDGQNPFGDKPAQSRFARAGGFRERLETADDLLDSSSLPDQLTGGADGSRITAWLSRRGVTLPVTPESPTSSSSAADGSHGVVDTQQGGS